jgi:hypothetical protein
MQELETQPAEPEIKTLVVEASRALSALDALRLEDLARRCEALHRRRHKKNAGDREELARQAKEAANDLAVFARVLEATRANLNVMNRLREMRTGQLEYSERQARGGAADAERPAKGTVQSNHGAEDELGNH